MNICPVILDSLKSKKGGKPEFLHKPHTNLSTSSLVARPRNPIRVLRPTPAGSTRVPSTQPRTAESLAQNPAPGPSNYPNKKGYHPIILGVKPICKRILRVQVLTWSTQTHVKDLEGPNYFWLGLPLNLHLPGF